MKKGFALLLVMIFLLLISSVIGLIMINIASMSVTVAKLPENYVSIYGNQSIVALGYMLIATNQTATTIQYDDTMYSATIIEQNVTPQDYTLYTLQGIYNVGQATLYYLKDTFGNVYYIKRD